MKISQVPYQISISKDELSRLPMADYHGGAEVIDSEEGLAEAVEHLRNSRIVGFDTETRPSFKRGVSYDVSLLQLASPTRAFLFRLNILGLHPLLRELLEDSKLLKVGVSLRDDFHALARIGNIRPAGFIDLQQYVKCFNIADNSLARIYAILFSKRISKGQRLTNWEAPLLTPAQINYAAFDAISCIQIYDYISSGQFKPVESPFAHPVPTE